MTTRESIIQAIHLTTTPSHYVMQFDCDECVCVLTRKQLLAPSVPSVGSEATVLWNGVEYSAKILAMGDSASAYKAERAILLSMDNTIQPIMKSLSNINTTVNILEKTLTVVLVNLQEVKSKQTNLEFQLQQLVRKERALATSTPVRTQPTSEMIVELAPETTTGHQAQPKLLPIDCDPVTVTVEEEEMKLPHDTSANKR